MGDMAAKKRRKKSGSTKTRRKRPGARTRALKSAAVRKSPDQLEAAMERAYSALDAHKDKISGKRATKKQQAESERLLTRALKSRERWKLAVYRRQN